MPIPTEEEALASGEATLPEDVPLEGVILAEDLLRAVDFVQARKIVLDPDPTKAAAVVTSEFFVTAAVGSVVSGSPLGDLSQDDGWSFEVIRRAPVELPATMATITAVLEDGRSVLLTGKGPVWMDEAGDLVDPGLIISFELAGG